MAQEGPIVVGTDGSERADRAVDRAGELARVLQVKVHVVSGYRGSSGLEMASARGFAAVDIQGEDQARTRAEHAVGRAEQRLAELGVDCEAHVWSGDPVDALVTIADEQKAQMIVVGNRGMTGARRVLGSVPNSVSHHAHCAVLIVPTA
jgi:nucleotide-binding universal stress UspA family protein